MRLQWLGGFRQLRASLKTARGIFFLGFVTVMSLYGLASLYFASRVTSQSPQFSDAISQMQQDFLPLAMLVMTTYVVLFSTGESTVYFTASEAAFLFPAPFTRKQLLTYTLQKSLLGMAGVSLFFSLFTTTGIIMVIPRWIAISLTLAFLQLLTMNVAFLRSVLQEKVHTVIRRSLGLLIGLAIVVVLMQSAATAIELDFTAYWNSFRESTVLKWLLSPFQVFVGALRAPDLLSFIPYAAVLMLVDGLLLQLAYRLDALSLEAALAFSEKMTAKLKMMQNKGVWHAMAPASSAVARRRISQFPFWGGVGPVLWQKMTTTFRVSNRLIWILAGAIMFSAGLVAMIGRSEQGRAAAAPIAGVAAMGYMSFLICMMLQNDIDRVGYLKSLPIRSLSIVLGDLIGFPILLSLIQVLFFVGLAGFFPKLAVALLCGALLTLPLNLLLFEVDKLVFYIYPTRMAKGAPGDFQNAGKQMIFVALKMLLLGGAALIVGIASLPGALFFQSPVVGLISAGVILIIECAALIPLLVIVFDRFDPSTTIVR